MSFYDELKEYLKNNYNTISMQDGIFYVSDRHEAVAYEKDGVINTWHKCGKSVIFNHNNCAVVAVAKDMEFPTFENFKDVKKDVKFIKSDAIYVKGLYGSAISLKRFNNYGVLTTNRPNINLTPSKNPEEDYEKEIRRINSYRGIYQEQVDALSKEQQEEVFKKWLESQGCSIKGDISASGAIFMPSAYPELPIKYFGEISKSNSNYIIENEKFTITVPNHNGDKEVVYQLPTIPISLIQNNKYSDLHIMNETIFNNMYSVPASVTISDTVIQNDEDDKDKTELFKPFTTVECSNGDVYYLNKYREIIATIDIIKDKTVYYLNKYRKIIATIDIIKDKTELFKPSTTVECSNGDVYYLNKYREIIAVKSDDIITTWHTTERENIFTKTNIAAVGMAQNMSLLDTEYNIDDHSYALYVAGTDFNHYFHRAGSYGAYLYHQNTDDIPKSLKNLSVRPIGTISRDKKEDDNVISINNSMFSASIAIWGLHMYNNANWTYPENYGHIEISQNSEQDLPEISALPVIRMEDSRIVSKMDATALLEELNKTLGNDKISGATIIKMKENNKPLRESKLLKRLMR